MIQRFAQGFVPPAPEWLRSDGTPKHVWPPRRAGDAAQPCGGKVERGSTVRERAMMPQTPTPPGYAETREAAMTAFTKSWRRE